MDEPTTGNIFLLNENDELGLDSFTANNLIQTLVNLSKKGRSIFISIHQPRSDIFKLFDSIILLSKGSLIYAGQGRESIISYFEELSFQVPQDVNPADFFIDISSIDVRDEMSEKTTNENVDHLIVSWNEFKSTQPQLGKSPLQQIDGIEMQTLTSKIPEDQSIRKLKGANSIEQTEILVRRSWINLMRDNLSLWGNLLEVLLVSTIFGAIFFHVFQILFCIFLLVSWKKHYQVY